MVSSADINSSQRGFVITRLHLFSRRLRVFRGYKRLAITFLNRFELTNSVSILRGQLI